MLPVDVLVIEHKLIIRVVTLIRKEVEQIVKTNSVEPSKITQFIAILRVYADKYHHGKEEGILFKELSQRHLSEADQKMMNDLVLEHALARKTVTSLENAKESYAAGKTEVIHDVLQLLSTLVELYPRHIEKEDKQFFYQSMKYFNKEEQDDLLKSCILFDQNFTNKYYTQIVKTLEA